MNQVHSVRKELVNTLVLSNSRHSLSFPPSLSFASFPLFLSFHIPGLFLTLFSHYDILRKALSTIDRREREVILMRWKRVERRKERSDDRDSSVSICVFCVTMCVRNSGKKEGRKEEYTAPPESDTTHQTIDTHIICIPSHVSHGIPFIYF